MHSPGKSDSILDAFDRTFVAILESRVAVRSSNAGSVR